MIERYKKSLLESPATMSIILTNIVVYIALNTMPSLAGELLLSPNLDKIAEDPWTLITVAFSHQIHVHLLVNMGLLFFFGVEMEKVTRTITVLLVYLASGLLGSLTFIITAPFLGGGDAPAVGASAAVWGVVAAYAVMRPDARVLGSKARFWPAALFVGNVILFILNPTVSTGAGAHAVGIAAGLTLGYWLKNREPERVGVG